MKVLDIINDRRSVRDFTDEDVSNEEIETVMEAARWAPSWANTQCWDFVIVRDNGTKQRLLDAFGPTNPGRKSVEKAPALIVVCGRKKGSGAKGGEYVTTKGDWLMFDCALATQNICLQAHALGLGTVILGFFDAETVAKILEIPDDVEVVVIVPIGRPARVPKAPKRRELSEIIHWERY